MGLAWLLCSGCLNIQPYAGRTFAVTVRDAETGEPISAANISVKYESYSLNGPPSDVFSITNNEGIATIAGTSWSPQDWSVSADHYQILATETNWQKYAEYRLYRLPPPHVTIVVPNAFHGPLKIELKASATWNEQGNQWKPVTHWIQGEAGRRNFSFQASSTGYVSILAAPLLTRVFARGANKIEGTLNVIAENGQAVPVKFVESGTKIAHPLAWPFDSGVYIEDIQDIRLLLFVGSQTDASAFLATLAPRMSHGVSLVSRDIFNSLFDEAATSSEPSQK